MDRNRLQDALVKVELEIAATQARLQRLRENIKLLERNGGNTEAPSDLMTKNAAALWRLIEHRERLVTRARQRFAIRRNGH